MLLSHEAIEQIPIRTQTCTPKTFYMPVAHNNAPNRVSVTTFSLLWQCATPFHIPISLVHCENICIYVNLSSFVCLCVVPNSFRTQIFHHRKRPSTICVCELCSHEKKNHRRTAWVMNMRQCSLRHTHTRKPKQTHTLTHTLSLATLMYPNARFIL